MAEEKKGLFKRIFSFGRSPKEEEKPENSSESGISIEVDVSIEIERTGQETPAETSQETPADIATEAIAESSKDHQGNKVVIEQDSEEALTEVPEAVSLPEASSGDDEKREPELDVSSTEEPEIEASPEPELDLVEEPEPDVVGELEIIKTSEITQEPASQRSWFQRLTSGLSKSANNLTGGIAAVFTKRKLDDDALQDLEDILIQADLGVETSMAITDRLSENRYGKDITDVEIRQVLADEVTSVLTPVARPLELDLEHKPHVVLVVGVNGTGKTTTIGKLTAKLRREGMNVMLAAGDTFRAAAVEQLKIWGERTGSPVVARDIGADASGLAFDAMDRAAAEGSDVLMIDTAGRLQNKTELMAELEKVIRVIKKKDETAPHTVLLTLDATTGQNALQQVEIFGKVAGVTGLVMTKLDGTARGGILVAIAAKHKLPIHFIGVGEGIDDLEPFHADEFAKAIAGSDAMAEPETT